MIARETCGARPCEHAAGERGKLRALALLTAHRRPDVIRARRALLLRLLETGRATIDDVRAELGPLSRRPTWLGAVPGELRDAGIIRRVGYSETHRAAAHARPVSIWELADRDKALRWLADNPAPDDGPADADGIGTRSSNGPPDAGGAAVSRAEKETGPTMEPVGPMSAAADAVQATLF